MPTSWAEARAEVVGVWCEARSRSRVGVEIDLSCSFSRSVTVSWSLEVPSATEYEGSLRVLVRQLDGGVDTL